MHLDMRSIIFVHSIINIVILFLSVLVWIGNRKQYPGTFGWMAGLFIAACGEVLIMFRGIIPDFFSIVISNTFLLSGFVIFYFGLRHFVENKVKGYFNIVFILIFFLLFYYFGIISPNVFIRCIIFSVCAVIISSQFVWFLLKNAKDKLKPAFIGLSVLFSFYAFVYVVRIITTIVWPPNENYIQSNTIENIYIIISQIVILIIGIFLVVIINKKLLTELQTYADENKLLVKEIHHRVKNNLQMILSLLYLQANKSDNEYIKESFISIRNRILSISIAHEKLYKQKDLRTIKIYYYLNNIINGLINSYEIQSSHINFTTNIPECKLDLNKAIPIGLIINELVTNSIKHAFLQVPFGMIKVRFNKDDNVYSLTVSDNGTGLPENFSIENKDTLGIQLLTTLTGQLEGTIEYSTNHETHFTIVFPV